MRKIIAILCVCLLLTGCGTRCEDAEDTSKEPEPYGEYFTLVKEWYDATGFEYEGIYGIYGIYIDRAYVLQILDKYKAESEGHE